MSTTYIWLPSASSHALPLPCCVFFVGDSCQELEIWETFEATLFLNASIISWSPSIASLLIISPWNTVSCSSCWKFSVFSVPMSISASSSFVIWVSTVSWGGQGGNFPFSRWNSDMCSKKLYFHNVWSFDPAGQSGQLSGTLVHGDVLLNSIAFEYQIIAA